MASCDAGNTWLSKEIVSIIEELREAYIIRYIKYRVRFEMFNQRLSMVLLTYKHEYR